MDIVEITAKDDLPYVLLHPQRGFIEIRGRSYSSKAQDFYVPIIKWVKRIKNLPLYQLEVMIALEHFNTASFKSIFDILFELEYIEEVYGIQITILWFYNSVDVMDAGTALSEILKLAFELKAL